MSDWSLKNIVIEQIVLFDILLSMMRTSEEGINFLKSWEGFLPESYICPAGKKTIGYGHVIRKEDVMLETASLELHSAEKILQNDLLSFESCVNSTKIFFGQNQFDALVSLCFNIGNHRFSTSTLLKVLQKNSTDYDDVNLEKNWLCWNKIRKNGQLVESSGLQRRRSAEWRLFKDGFYH